MAVDQNRLMIFCVSQDHVEVRSGQIQVPRCAEGAARAGRNSDIR